ncbi:hypothetical protein Thal_0002 [Thermocrinis albus DSM 14484]|uniref:Uncharacterized protein n=1 Tax=Thermocrinis albus (strain DSM 14484 / JCM 11386 / HI 11/12) TaxID=638303 RepID=D3SNA3_THEAH|nr:hypothetical protein [Thermocrinis albus]ADC88640.1 hypothetical protein Thal_0002 [Thermocrinis albus DSM 14484]
MKEKILALINGDLKTKSFFLNLIMKEARLTQRDIFLKKYLGENYEEEVFSQLILKLLSIKDALSKKEEINFHYVKKLIRSAIEETLKLYSHRFVSLEKLTKETSDGKEIRYEELLGKDERLDINIEVNELVNAILSILSEKDMEVLCYYLEKELYGKSNIEPSMTKDALYKRWERLKTKIRKNVYVPDETTLRYALEKILSDFCSKGRFIKGGYGRD